MNNIEFLREFVDGKTGSKLIVNQVSEDIAYFYVNLIEWEASSREIILNYQDSLVENVNNDLFSNNEIYILFSNNKKNIDKYVNSNIRCIIFTDYKNYKIYSSAYKYSVNGYNYQRDIKYFFKEILKIDNSDILDFCIATPYLAFSEISKYMINSSGYTKENKIKESHNFVLNIRKELFNLKRTHASPQKIYLNLKQEVKYKKLNFLAC